MKILFSNNGAEIPVKDIPGFFERKIAGIFEKQVKKRIADIQDPNDSAVIVIKAGISLGALDYDIRAPENIKEQIQAALKN